MIVDAQVDQSTNTLKLWKHGDLPDAPSITFRKAATKVSGSWSGGVLTVSADENGENSYQRFFQRGTVTWQNDKKAAYVNANVMKISGGTEYVDKVNAFQLFVPTTESYDKGWLDYFTAWHYPATIESGTISSDILVVHPGGTPDSADVTKTFTLNVTDDFAEVKSGSDVYARVPNTGGGGNVTLEDSAWDNGNKTVSAIQDGAKVATIIVQIPAVTQTAWINTEDDIWYASVRLGGTARRSDTMDFGDIRTAGYNSGWHDYFGLWTYPATIGPSVTSANIVVEHPGSTPTSATLSKTFTLSVSGGYATVSSGSAVYARIAVQSTLTGNWTGATLTVSSDPPAAQNYRTVINDMFVKDGNKYYVSATKDGTELTTTRKQIALGKSGSSIVITDGAQNPTVRTNTPSIALTLDTGTLNKQSGARTVTVNAGGAATTCNATISDYLTGWHDYFGLWTYPATIGPNVISANIIVKHPGSAPTSTELSKTFTLAVANGYATVSSGDAVYARVSAVTTPTLTGDWSGAKLTVSSNPAAVSNFTTTIGSTFVKDGNKYYVSATKDGTELTTTRKQIKLAGSGANIVVQDGAGSTRANTPSIALTLDTGTLNKGTGERTVTVKAGGVATTCNVTISDYGNGYSTGHSEGYDEGYADGAPTGATLGTKKTGDVWNVSIQRKTGDPVASTISLTDAYTDARSGYYTAAQYNAYGQTQYNTGRTQGHNDIYKITLDSGNNHANDWWNVMIYDSSGTLIKKIETDQAKTGLYIPFVSEAPMKSNKTYEPSEFKSDGGKTAVMIGKAKVEVPKGGTSYANQLTFRCDSVQGGSTYTIKLTGTPGAAMGSKFKVGSTYTMHWNW